MKNLLATQFLLRLEGFLWRAKDVWGVLKTIARTELYRNESRSGKACVKINAKKHFQIPIPLVPEGTGFASEDCGMQCKAQNVDGSSLTPSRLCNAAMRPQDRSQDSIFRYEGYSHLDQKLAYKNGVFFKGQGMTEYLIIVALVAVAAIAVYQLFGQVIRNQTAAIATEISGGNGQSAINAAAANATSARSDANTQRSLSTYVDNNGRAATANAAD